MKIGINASFARKPNTGIGQVATNFLRKLILSANQSQTLGTISKNDKLEFILYLEDDLPVNFKLPENFKKQIFRPAWKRDDLIRKIWWEKYLLPKKVSKDGCDAFFSLYQSTTVLPHKIKHIMLVHDIIPKIFPEYLNNWRKKLYWKLTEKAIKAANKIIAISKRTEKDLIQKLKIGGEKITVNYIDVDEIYKSLASDAKTQEVLNKYNLKKGYILNGGGLEIRKNTEGMIRAYKYLLEKNKHHYYVSDFPQLVIFGKLMPELVPLATDAEKLIRELNLTQYIKLLDFVPQEDLPAIYKNASVFVYPSFYEGFGLPLLEAMNQGIPVIASKTSSLPEVGGDSVLYCDPDDIRDIAMTIRNILVNRDLHQTLSERGKERANNFSWQKFMEKNFNIIATK